MPRARRGVRLSPPIPSGDIAAATTLHAQRTNPKTISPTQNNFCTAHPLTYDGRTRLPLTDPSGGG
jgi:hypothetical protein